MKDAADLVHALQENLGWTELRLREHTSSPQDPLALRLLSTCQHLSQLLAGAVAIARRDVCANSLNTQEVSLGELADTIRHALTTRACLVESSSSIQDRAVTVLYDPDITSSVVDRMLGAFVVRYGDRAAWTVRVGLKGVNAAIAVRSAPLDATSSESPTAGSGVTKLEAEFEDTIAICTASLARQGAALGFEVDDTGAGELTIVWPARLPNTADQQAPGIAVAPANQAPVSSDAPEQEKWSGTMAIQSDRFGTIEVEEQDIIRFPHGIIGFSDEHSFILIRTKSNAVGWLQSTTNPSLALPVVSAHVLAPPYPDVDIESYAQAVGLGARVEELAVVVVLNAQAGVPATVNLVAPIIVNVTTRIGGQVILDGTRFTTREMFILPAAPENTAQPSGEAISAAE
jgi:flagellar assembly factor FliW